MKTQKEREKLSRNIKFNIATNFVLGVLVLSVGALCLSPAQTAMATENAETPIYRNAGENSQGVSLMFNVYWGTEEVYKILDILEQNSAKATFFIGGSWADDNVECLRAISSAGHELGNHGYFHKDHSKMSLEQNKREIANCNEFIQLALGRAPELFAPPSGAYNTNTLSACKALNMKTILWSRDTIDWRDKDRALIYRRATKEIKGGEFVLMHPMPATVDALGDILNYYETQNLSVITVGENLQNENKG